MEKDPKKLAKLWGKPPLININLKKEQHFILKLDNLV